MTRSHRIKRNERKPLKNLTTKRLIVPLFALDVQRRIISRVDELMALCDRLEASASAGSHQHYSSTSLAVLRSALPQR
jgi:hypothetical protein